jgi:hypothetical protein
VIVAHLSLESHKKIVGNFATFESAVLGFASASKLQALRRSRPRLAKPRVSYYYLHSIIILLLIYMYLVDGHILYYIHTAESATIIRERRDSSYIAVSKLIYYLFYHSGQLIEW